MKEIIRYSSEHKHNRTFIQKKCDICKKRIEVLKSEVSRGGGKTCSRQCYYERFRKIVKREEQSPNWKGDNVGKGALHNWVERHRGKPRKCEHCNTTKSKYYDWANISQEHKRDLSDWTRLCRSCHSKLDYKHRKIKWKATVERKGWTTRDTVMSKGGVEHTVMEWSEILNVSVKNLLQRIKRTGKLQSGYKPKRDKKGKFIKK